MPQLGGDTKITEGIDRSFHIRRPRIACGLRPAVPCADQRPSDESVSLTFLPTSTDRAPRAWAGTAFWDEMKRDAHRPFDVSNKKVIPDGLDAIRIIAATLKGTTTKFHLAGHSTGGVLIGHLLNALDTLKINDLIKTCTLFAPACTVDFYKENYAARLKPDHRGTRLPVLDIYNLSEKLELDDNVAKAYRKSLLWLVSNALERERGKSLLGMQAFSKELEGTKRLNPPDGESYGARIATISDKTQSTSLSGTRTHAR